MIVKQNSADGLSRRKILKYGLYGSLTAPLAPCLWLSGCARSQPPKGPNVILIIVDTLRPDHLGCYGYSRNTSPNIDLFAADSLLFENCFAHAPSTSASVASILSGFLPHETKVTNRTIMAPQIQTLPLILQDHRYKTTAVVSNYVLRQKRGWEKGFDKYDAEMKDRELNRNLLQRNAEHTTDRAIKLLKKSRKDNLFMWIHYQDPHGPYTPPENFGKLFKSTDLKPRLLKLNNISSGRRGIPKYQKLGDNRDFHHYVSQYDAEIRYNDEHLKRLFDSLKKLGLYHDSLIIFTADHGEGMGEHDYYFAHGENLYNILTHVPLIIKCPAELTGRKTDFVQHIDIVPTILKNLHIAPDPRLQGCDLRTEIPVGREIFAKMETGMVRDNVKYSILADDFKLIHTPLYDRYELYNMTEDFNEELDLANDPHHRPRTEDLKIRLKRIRKQDSLRLGTIKSPKLTDEELEKLKSLGYVR
ncbi:MAG: sulfatase [Planctomycetota bacterium]|jgi:arylsulfatase